MLLGLITKNPPPLLQLNGQPIERVRAASCWVFKGVAGPLQRDEHVTSLCSRATQRLYFLQQLKHAAMSPDGGQSDVFLSLNCETRHRVCLRCVVFWSDPRTNQTAGV